MRRRWLVVATGLVVLAGLAWLRVLDPEALRLARLRAFDLYQQLQPRPVPADLPVRVVTIDEAALDALGQWPWPRTVIATLVERLHALGAASIGFDVVFAEPDRTSPRNLLGALPDRGDREALEAVIETLQDHDVVLSKSFERAPVVGAVALLGDDSGDPQAPRGAGFAFGGSDPRQFVRDFPSTVRNLPLLEQGLTGHGSITFTPDRDGVIRRIPLLQAVGDRLVVGLSAESLRVAQGASTILTRAADASGEISFGAPGGLTTVKIGNFAVPVTHDGEFWLWHGEPQPDRMVSAARLFEPDWRGLQERVAGHIVLIGASAQGLRDQRATPLSGAVPGVQIHAEAIEQMIAGQFLVRPDWAPGAELVGLVVAGLVMILLLPAVGPLGAALLGAAAFAAGLAGAWFAFDRFGFLLDPLFPALATLLVYLAMTTARFAFSERERSQVRRAFSRYLAPALVERLAERPEGLKLGGESRELTILFADIRGFTALSESLPPEVLTARLNRFLTPMTEALLDQGATIDKYIGDAIMAFWNAPLDQADHAARALRGALAMRERLAALAPQWAAEDRAAGREAVELRFGLGLNSGSCVVGNLGSEQRFDYSAIGDPVNLAARLEGLSKVYGLDVLVGEATAALAPDFALLEIDRVRVLGRSRPLAVFALLGDETVAGEPGFQALARDYGAALEAYRRGDWAAAESGFRALAERADAVLQPALAAFLARLEARRGSPLPEGWDGTYEAERK